MATYVRERRALHIGDANRLRHVLQPAWIMSARSELEIYQRAGMASYRFRPKVLGVPGSSQPVRFSVDRDRRVLPGLNGSKNEHSEDHGSYEEASLPTAGGE